MSRPATGNTPKPIYAVRAEAVPVLITAHQFGKYDFRIKLARGIGWAPKIYKTREEVLTALLGMKSYGIAEAKMCKAVCTPDNDTAAGSRSYGMRTPSLARQE